MTAKIEGCSPIIAIDIHDSRLEIARELGATHTINVRTEDLATCMAVDKVSTFRLIQPVCRLS